MQCTIRSIRGVPSVFAVGSRCPRMVFVGWVEGTELIEEAFVLPLQFLYVQLKLSNLPLWIVGQLGLLYKEGPFM